MTNPTYKRLAKRTTQLLAKYGATLVLRGKRTASDPVTGQGGSNGADRDVIGVLSKVEEGYFTESLRKAGDRMIVLAPESAATVGETWIDGTAEWRLLEVKAVKPDNQTVIAHRALVRG